MKNDLHNLIEMLRKAYDLEAQGKKNVEESIETYKESKAIRKDLQGRLAELGWDYRTLHAPAPSAGYGELTEQAEKRNTEQDQKAAKVVAENIADWLDKLKDNE